MLQKKPESDMKKLLRFAVTAIVGGAGAAFGALAVLILIVQMSRALGGG